MSDDDNKESTKLPGIFLPFTSWGRQSGNPDSGHVGNSLFLLNYWAQNPSKTDIFHV